MTNNKPFFNQILNLEARILEDLAKDSFCSAVRNNLQRFDFSTFKGMISLTESLLSCKNTLQYYPPNGFGKFNLTLASNAHFFIIAMFMDEQSTEIHTHPFEGVFTPLKGSPIHLSFDFKKELDLSPMIEKGLLNIAQISTLTPGELVEINQATIHMLIRPSGGQFSLLVARRLAVDKQQNHFFLYPHLKIKNSKDMGYLSRVLSCLSFDEQINDSELDELVSNLATDELIHLYFRMLSPQLITQTFTISQMQKLSNRIEQLLKNLNFWNYLSLHQKFLMETKIKTSILV